jgi:hypothetical protein
VNSSESDFPTFLFFSLAHARFCSEVCDFIEKKEKGERSLPTAFTVCGCPITAQRAARKTVKTVKTVKAII